MYIFGGEDIEQIGTNAFKNDDEPLLNLKNVEIASGILVIRSEAFAGSGIRYIKLPDTLKWIQREAFQNCTNLTYISLPSSKLTNLGENLFFGTDILAINYLGTKADWDKILKTNWKNGASQTMILYCTDSTWSVTGGGDGTYTKIS